ncbi:DUF4846 domain-containing protein [Dinghuibacter silviterrae]|uniref:Uncharacterized protein DUF4846 n=1 Tax=Dinghuibacter silviterrae TaxID=1539049 RepID=A0A4R8DQA4_9BACT|nr:DUF4846 domain-containing protein [Dinghuibacter silviterrae]TDX00320.1 uncharacterized protein DUF4846 [Dinghuibacter silviterrae]
MKPLFFFAAWLLCAAPVGRPGSPHRLVADARSARPADRVADRFPAPPGYRLSAEAQGSFGDWLTRLPLKPAGTPTRTYRGDIAATNAYTAAVLDVSVGHQDLQQCADAVMRLRGEYLYGQKRYKDIVFTFTGGFRCDYIHYAEGYRYSGGHWVLKKTKDYSYATFLHYMDLVFTYCGTLSLEKELKPIQGPLKAGDIFIHGGSPGHCFIILETAVNGQGQPAFIIAQSFMPAQDIQVLQAGGSPWFSLDTPASLPYRELISLHYAKRFNDL